MVVSVITGVPLSVCSVQAVPSSSLPVGDVVAAVLAGGGAAGVLPALLGDGTLPLASGDAAGLLVLSAGDGVVGAAHADSVARQTNRTYSECFRISIPRIAQQRLCE
jgi:hypothetical protein